MAHFMVKKTVFQHAISKKNKKLFKNLVDGLTSCYWYIKKFTLLNTIHLFPRNVIFPFFINVPSYMYLHVCLQHKTQE